MNSQVYVLGGYQTDFARRYDRENLGLLDLIRECAEQTLYRTGVAAESIDAAHVGNFIAELFCKQSHLGGLLAEAVPGLRGIPMARHEAACASGSMAILSAMADIEAGRHDLVLVLGVEAMRHVDGERAAQCLAPAAWTGHEAQHARHAWPALFNDVRSAYEERHGLQQSHLCEIARKNFANAKLNSNAQTRNWLLGDDHFGTDDTVNPVIEGRIRRHDCAQITDGACALVLASNRTAAEHASRHGMKLENLPRFLGWGHRTERISLSGKLADSAAESLIFPHVNDTVYDALDRAGLRDAWELDGIETHDCFTISEYMAIDHFGLTQPGENWKAVEAGWHQLSGKLPINASGGLIGCGHPVGATGIRMLLDACRQVTGQAGDYQIPGARRMATLNIGGSTTTAASFIVGVG